MGQFEIQPRINANERESEEDETRKIADSDKLSKFVSALRFQGLFILILLFQIRVYSR